LNLITWRDHNNIERHWESVKRLGTPGAVAIIATLEPSGRYILIQQFRPPTNGMTLEFPAGLIDPGESAASTAIRELKEETGYKGELMGISPISLTSPGMSSEGVFLARVHVDESQTENQTPSQECEETEQIEVFLKSGHELADFFKDRIANGVQLDNRVASFFMGAGLFWTSPEVPIS
jgi:8-oxo-dGTP pyrophosphatase MutT (NUDIX family)